MDEVRAFLNNPRPSSSQMIKLRGTGTGGLRITKDNSIDLLNRREEHRHSMVPSGTDYARIVKEKEINVYLKNESERSRALDSDSEDFESMEQLPSCVINTANTAQLTDEAMSEVYNKYTFQVKEDTNKLAINDYKDQILDYIRCFPVVIIEGPTGCGKTTQVPQWILDDRFKDRKPCKIIVTQPRRIAAISIAKRVAQERGWDVGGVVGYQVGLENCTSNDTRIHYVTTGVLLQKLVGSKNLDEYSHIILDEVHERGQEMDFLLLVVKKLLYTVSPSVKVVLMSATFNLNAFNNYFLIPTRDGLQTTSCIKVAKKEGMFSVKTFYLDQLGKFGPIVSQATPKGGEAIIHQEMYHLVIKLVNAFEQIDKKEDCITDHTEAELPSVLIFLPGINEIEDLYNCLNDMTLREKMAGKECTKYRWRVLPLHSTITADEQARVFLRAPPGTRKIILSTNIAESSITVPDIKYVIDFCLMKILVADQNTNFTSLQLCWASKNNCDQRAGRAGRVRDGRVYRLIPELFYNALSQECPPEIVRCPLERLVLLAKMLDMGPPSDVLALAMDPPDVSNIYRTILVLKEIGALKKTVEGEWSNIDGDVTYLGRIMAKLPIDVKLSKLIALGYVYGCLDECIIMAAAMSVKNLFNSPFRERLNAFTSKLTWADGSTSDCIAFLNAYNVWHRFRRDQYFRKQGDNQAEWTRRFYLQLRALRDLDDLVREIRRRLTREGIEPTEGHAPWDKAEIPLVLKILIAGAFYPQYFVQVSQDEARERDAVRILGGLDPRNTVYLQQFPEEQPGQVYVAAIKKTIRQLIGDEPRVTFDKNSRKVYLTFNEGQNRVQNNENQRDPTIPGQVVLPVYKAIKARQLRMDIRIPLLPLEKANELAATLQMENMELDITKMVPRLPDIDDTHFPLKISHKISVGRFWARYDDASTTAELRQLQAALHGAPLLAHTGPVRAGHAYAAPAADGTRHRVRVTRLLPRDMVEVLYVDVGASGSVSRGNLQALPAGPCRATPPLAMRCALAEVAPSPLLDAHGKWSKEANAFFDALVRRPRLLAKVYSVTHGVVSLELLADGGNLSVNKELIIRGFAIASEESYDSKLNHDIRQQAPNLNLVQKRAFTKEQTEQAFFQQREIDPPSSRDCVTDVCLKGPHSPLETHLHSLMYASRDNAVNIEWHSVNSVLLDTAPQEIYERLVVAAEVGQNEQSNRITLRHTTLMPNIPCLPAIVSLLFCPAAELRRDESCSRYVSVLCGLGSHRDGAPYFPEHDLLVTVDADLHVEDIGQINHIRYLTDSMLFCAEGQIAPGVDEQFRQQVPGQIRNDLMELLRKRRKHREPASAPNAWAWRSVPEHELLEVGDAAMHARAAVYPLHAALDLHRLPRDALQRLKRDNDDLKDKVERMAISTSVQLACSLCGTAPMPLHAMRIHLYSNAHREKEEDFRIYRA